MLLLFRFINIKIFILICLYTIPIKAQSSIDFLDSTFNKIYAGLSFYNLISYRLKLTTLEANNVISNYTAEVTEVHNNNASYVIYKINNKQLLFSYSNILGIQRFWLGKIEDLPEVYSKDIDNKILNTAISYINLNVNPLWFNIPINYKYDQGFLLVQTYSKNLFTNFPKVEIYVNKENVPIRTLYYNKISNFPVLEVLITDYKKEGNGYFIYKTEYKDNSSKKVTIIEKSEVKFDISIPEWFEEVEGLINSNTNNYYNSFMMGIRDRNNISDLDEYFNKFSLKESNNDLTHDKNIDSKNSKDVGRDSGLELPNIAENDINTNNTLLQELDSLNEDSLMFKDSVLDNSKNGRSIINEDKNEIIPKIKGKPVYPNNKEEKNISKNNKDNLNKTRNVKIKNKNQDNLIKKDKDLSTKKSISEKSLIKTKELNNKENELKKIPNKNSVPDNTSLKQENSLKFEEPTIKNIPENREDSSNGNIKDIPLKKEKKKNTLNNLF